MKFSYSFNGWSPEIGAVIGNTTYTAQYTAETNKYAVNFVDEDGKLLEKQSVLGYGECTEYTGDEPEKEETARFTYRFEKWTPISSAVTSEDVTYSCLYRRGKNGLCIEGDDTYWIENGEKCSVPGPYPYRA